MRNILPILPAVLLSACSVAESTPSEPSGTRSFDLSGFDKVELAGSDDVRIVAGPVFSINATGTKKALNKLKIEVKNSTLSIGRNRSISIGWNNDESALVTVTMPLIKEASVAGSGDMSIDRVETPDFVADLAGSGKLNVKSAQVEKLSVSIAGSGDVTLAGSTKTIDISIAGSGSVMAKDVSATDASVSIAGSGNVNARASGVASVSVAGSGDVNITGTTNCKTSKMGSGEVRCTP
jgi:hypothetical protein